MFPAHKLDQSYLLEEQRDKTSTSWKNKAESLLNSCQSLIIYFEHRIKTESSSIYILFHKLPNVLLVTLVCSSHLWQYNETASITHSTKKSLIKWKTRDSGPLISTLGSLKILAMGTFILSYKLFFYYKPVIYTKTFCKTLTNKKCSWAQEIFYAFRSALQRH